MSNLIDRQVAIDMIRLYREDEAVDLDELESSIAMMPSAQPEVIRCKDCVNHVDDRCLAANHHTGDTEYCMEVFGAKMKGEQP